MLGVLTEPVINPEEDDEVHSLLLDIVVLADDLVYPPDVNKNDMQVITITGKNGLLVV